MVTVPFDKLEGASLVVDAIYEGGRNHARNTHGGSPRRTIRSTSCFRCGVPVGIRERRAVGSAGVPFVVLVMNGDQPDWPDRFDATTGDLLYYGDNRQPGRPLLAPIGNRVLESGFERWANGDREHVPVFLAFERRGVARSYRFVGAAAPGGPTLDLGDALVPVGTYIPMGVFRTSKHISLSWASKPSHDRGFRSF